jgi:(p)ppGpp synthase/HD superfamily hydrolase
MKATLEDALLYAIEAHRGQKDKSNLPYILHPISVMLQMDTDEERILALCHDIAENTSKSPHDVASDLGMNSEWEAWLDALTHRKDVPYLDYIKVIKLYPTAVKVKLADLSHNLSRLKNLPAEDQGRLSKKYKGGIEALRPHAIELNIYVDVVLIPGL